MRQKNTPIITKGIVTNHMKVITMIMKVITTKDTIMTTKDMTIRTMATIMKAITMQKKPTITMLMLTKVIATMHTTTAMTMEAIRMKSFSHLTRQRQQV